MWKHGLYCRQMSVLATKPTCMPQTMPMYDLHYEHVILFYVAQNCPVRNGYLLGKVFGCGLNDYLHTQEYVLGVRYNHT